MGRQTYKCQHILISSSSVGYFDSMAQMTIYIDSATQKAVEAAAAHEAVSILPLGERASSGSSSAHAGEGFVGCILWLH